MNIPRKARTFLCDGEGAVSVDWVVVTFAVVGIAIALLSVVRSAPSETRSASTSQLAASSPAFP